jgi:hypothetical protein
MISSFETPPAEVVNGNRFWHDGGGKLLLHVRIRNKPDKHEAEYGFQNACGKTNRIQFTSSAQTLPMVA